MIEDLPDSPASRLKAEFVQKYDGNGHIREAIPQVPSDLIPASGGILEGLHKFAAGNPIYYNSYEMEILGVPCTVYEGDINEYWINSIKHDASGQPFYPTWILSAYEAAREAKRIGARQLVDIGSGDGRIAYCGQMLGLDSYGIEIDASLARLQEEIAARTGTGFSVINADADSVDYDSLALGEPAFFMGGLPEMGEILARNTVARALSGGIGDRSVFVFMGSFQLKKFSRSMEKWGWGFLIDEMGLEVISTTVLPTCWTMDQQKDTPYIFTRAGRQAGS